MRIILTGYTGHMGREVRTCAEATDHCEIVAGVDPMIPASEGICKKSFDECTAEADVIIDFSHHSMTGALLDFAEAKKLGFHTVILPRANMRGLGDAAGQRSAEGIRLIPCETLREAAAAIRKGQ